MLKCQFHCHTAGDGADNIPHTPKQLINEAHKLSYNVVSITCHRKVVFSKQLKQYALKKGILLIPGCEFEINKKHILGINITKEIEKVDTFEKLKNYKKKNKKCFIIAPHPYFPGKTTLQGDLESNIDLFDAIEISFCYTKSKNYNKKAIEIAQKYNKPLIATADCHDLKELNNGYTLINSPLNTENIFDAIKKQKTKNIHTPKSYLHISNFIIRQGIRNLFKRKS
ncbi:hypothetical protein COU74_04765 [Candidatus Peregrinibacteria bacterium CG10_big_fil_rev_8_21_14_0_10_36_19]|nr:MAG: hypothetical protein COU74_04765 [Candidatus Peregrinibacteria bacterium CG10_big_fil_rev_8_21_14_0_10_36_19]